MTEKSWIYAVVPVQAESNAKLRRAGFECVATPADRGDGYAILRRRVKYPEAIQQCLDKHQITSWVRAA